MKGIEQIKHVPRDGEIPGAYVLVAPVDWLSWRTDAFLAAIHGVYKAFPVTSHYYHVIPESKELYFESGRGEPLPKIFNLRAFPGAVESGKANQ